ncbi:MAG: tetratricopeptide repeat protein [Promethearchaeota archaeon]|jgi:tetratricopeptide (TPR) repeat protein
MSESKGDNKPKELIDAEQLIIEGKFGEAYQIMDTFKERGDFTLRDALLCNLLKLDIMFQQGLYEDVIELANQTYKECRESRANDLAFDVLNIKTQALLTLNNMDESLKSIKEGEEILKIIPQELPIDYKKRGASLEYLKAWFYYNKNEIDEIETHLDSSMALLEETGESRLLAIVLLNSIMFYALLKGEFDLALNNIKKGYAISKRKNYKYGIALGLLSKGVIYGLQGYFGKSVTYHERSLATFKELSNEFYVANILNNLSGIYRDMGDLESAFESIELSIKYAKELGNSRMIGVFYDFLIQLLIDKGELKKAQKTIEELEHLNNQLNNSHIKQVYLFNKALLLKVSSRSRDRIEAEDILKQIIENETIWYENHVKAILNLCELLLIELRISNDLSLLDEINIYTAKLLTIAEKNHSYILFAEVYFLKAKLALLTLDLKTARRFLIQAQRISERFGYDQLAAKISIEHNNLLNQLSIWDDFKHKEVSLSERIKFAGMDVQMRDLLQNRAILTVPVKEEEVTIHREKRVCMVCRGEVVGYMYTCQCDTIYCDKCTQALAEIENICWVCNAPLKIS